MKPEKPIKSYRQGYSTAIKTRKIEMMLMEKYNISEGIDMKAMYKRYITLPGAGRLGGWIFERHALLQTSLTYKERSRGLLKDTFPMEIMLNQKNLVFSVPNKAEAISFGPGGDLPHPLQHRTLTFIDKMKDVRFDDDADIDINEGYFVPTDVGNPLFDAVFFQLNSEPPVMWVVQVSTDATGKPPGSRQDYPVLEETKERAQEWVDKGGYLVDKPVQIRFMFVVPQKTQKRLQDIRFKLPDPGDTEKEKWSGVKVYVQFVEF
ncbi:hypothetical protein D9758_010581 [Tetrapyrgos nigripes]|uniref:Uncharacterized protein n=1 Tax=Tetrapyrgos nigripes TaxID=182062 RepID=A0A8H5FYW2_9AGAR|nr:hypothetical protein D9758_010581 [Tetrapyrgos nigripes]